MIPGRTPAPRLDGPQTASAQSEEEGPPVLVAQCAVEEEVPGRIEGDEEVENVAESLEEGLFVRLSFGLVKDFVDQSGRGGLFQKGSKRDGHR